MLSLKIVRGAENADGVRPIVNIPPDQARFVVGRDPACDWPIADRQLALSARHCEIVRVEGRQVLRDTSTNGTFVNDARERLPADHVLRHGDRLRLGSYVVEVSVVSDVAAAGAAAPAATSAPVAPRRGGDPAAMAGADWERVAMRMASASPDMKTGMTRIAKPPPKAATPDLAATRPNLEMPAVETTAPTPPVSERDVAAPATPHAALGSSDVLARLAGALQVPVEALGTTDPALAADRVATLLRLAVWALHRQLSEQAQQLSKMRSRWPLTLSRSAAAPLRMAPKPGAAMEALLDAGTGANGMLVMAMSELGKHSKHLSSAFDAAGQRLGEQLAPQALERAADGHDDPASVWRIYSRLWTALGIGVGKDWVDGYREAAASYLAEAYDEAAAKDAASGPATGNNNGAGGR
ncbi:MAG: FHA domain-containing protein [Betaproteobacteria bacterium]|nr:FHA domain-containing protein [Betaproteobacteria bacterium]MCC6249227.1 FHA domain-containing protein [Rubrivivax sp.]